MFKVIEGGEGKLELLEVFARWHELWGLQVPSEVMGKAITCSDVVGDKGWCYLGIKLENVKEGEKLLDKHMKGFGGVVCM